MRPIIFLTLILVVLFKFAPQIDEPNIVSTSIQKAWTKEDSQAYARDKLTEWQDEQWSCLSKLWGKESAWNPYAFNRVKVSGKNAGGIPQLLGLDPSTPAPRQIERGLAYIYYRYDTPCNAWGFFQKNGWH